MTKNLPYLFITAMLLLFVPSIKGNDTERLYDQLEQALKMRTTYSKGKEARIDSLKRQLYPTMDKDRLYKLYNDIYQEYYTYCFDSAMLYVDKKNVVAKELNNRKYISQTQIHRSVLLSTSGYFSESANNLHTITSNTLDTLLQAEYFVACEWAYNQWAEYSADKVYAPKYRKEAMAYIDSLVSILPKQSNEYHYWKAESLYRLQRYAESEKEYLAALDGVPMTVRLYAQVTYALSMAYDKLGNQKLREKYMILAATSDQMCPLKENMALQELALYIFKTDPDDVARANRYLGYSMDDAMFYNNRLRMLEIARKFPQIVTAYETQGKAKNQRLLISFVCISLLSVGLVVALFYIRKQIIRLHRQHEELKNLNEEQKLMNGQLKSLNEQLLTTNRTREQYVSLFMDLCAAYIEKLDNYQTLVKRKVKAHQTDDLLKLANATRMSEVDAKEFFVNFDTAFLTLYPSFITEFNALLRPNESITLKKNEIMNTELRIYALIRMGIKDSAKIATLLFYSPQTIYNYRSNVKSRAVNKESFDEDVMRICAL